MLISLLIFTVILSVLNIGFASTPVVSTGADTTVPLVTSGTPTTSPTTTASAKKSIVNLNFLIAMGIAGFFAVMITTYALYTYSLRCRKKRAMVKKKEQEKKKEREQEMAVIIEK